MFDFPLIFALLHSYLIFLGNVPFKLLLKPPANDLAYLKIEETILL